jgi:hypothetical protein
MMAHHSPIDKVRSGRPLMALVRARPLELENGEEQPQRVEVEDKTDDG